MIMCFVDVLWLWMGFSLWVMGGCFGILNIEDCYVDVIVVFRVCDVDGVEWVIWVDIN